MKDTAQNVSLSKNYLIFQSRAFFRTQAYFNPWPMSSLLVLLSLSKSSYMMSYETLIFFPWNLVAYEGIPDLNQVPRK